MYIFSVLYTIKCFWRTFTKNKHILKSLMIAIRKWKSKTILFIYHCIVQIKSNILERAKTIYNANEGNVPFSDCIDRAV